MLAFIDESGHPHPNDPNQWSVVVACCFSEVDSKRVAGTIHALKRDVLERERMEMKASKLLNRSIFKNRPDRVLFNDQTDPDGNVRPAIYRLFRERSQEKSL